MQKKASAVKRKPFLIDLLIVGSSLLGCGVLLLSGGVGIHLAAEHDELLPQKFQHEVDNHAGAKAYHEAPLANAT